VDGKEQGGQRGADPEVTLRDLLQRCAEEAKAQEVEGDRS
jgi:hypothetical protein